MRMILLAASCLTFAAPAAAQSPVPRGEEIEAMAPVIDRAADAMLDLDVGPIIDAADPYRRGPRVRDRRLRDIARRDDPYFDQRLRRQIYATTAAMAHMMDAIAAAEPAMRRSLMEMERGIDAAIRDARSGPPPRGVDDDWDRDFDDEGPDYDPDED